MSGSGYRLGVDFGTSNTTAALAGPDGRVRPLLFDGSPLLPSAVFAGPGTGLLVGGDAIRAAVGAPAGFEGNPKRRIDDRTVWLGEREFPTEHLIAAVLHRVNAEATRVAGEPVTDVVLTHPAAWARPRLQVLTAAAEAAGLGPVRFMPEPVAAAAYFAAALGQRIPPEHCIVVYDLGAGTFDVSIVRPAPYGFDVVAAAGLTDVGGLDLDAAVVEHARTRTATATEAWRRLDWPQTAADQQARQNLWQGAQAVKEQLSRHPSGDLHVPLVDHQVRMTREEFEKAARPQLDRTSALTLTVLQDGAVPPERIAGVFLVGGSSRIPLAATLLHRTLRIAPTVIDQPELVVAEGALHNRPVAPPAPDPYPTSGAVVAVPAVPMPVQPAAPSAMPVRTAPAPTPAARRLPTGAITACVAAVVVLVAGAVLAVTRPWESAGPADPASSPVAGSGPPATDVRTSAGPPAAQAAFPASWAGTWTGEYRQDNGKTYTTALFITSGSGVAQVRYPDIPCLGTVTVQSQDGGVIRAQEAITSGRCTPTGTMTMRLQAGNQLEVTYRPDGATYTAEAVLAR
ncbi:Hsp70 family protein [Dactylosporangium sp. NPDC051541]|uniref:Hsp70 family protein n=1 Tax=Dactylosporangium sp. NPDC051541 TaxID=3363977 RepID=UPI003796A311